MLNFITGFIVSLIGVFALFIYLSSPKKYRRITYMQLPALLRNLTERLRDRGRIYVSHKEAKGWIWLQMHKRKLNPSTLEFRFRNTDETKPHFEAVSKAFQESSANIEIELTEVRKKERSLKVEVNTDQAASYSGITNLCRIAFQAMGASSDGQLIVYAENPWQPSDGSLSAVKHPNKKR